MLTSNCLYFLDAIEILKTRFGITLFKVEWETGMIVTGQYLGGEGVINIELQFEMPNNIYMNITRAFPRLHDASLHYNNDQWSAHLYEEIVIKEKQRSHISDAILA